MSSAIVSVFPSFRFFITLLACGCSLGAQTYEWRTVAGHSGGSGLRDGNGTGARFHSPAGLALDGAGNLLVADEFNSAVRSISPAGLVTTIRHPGDYDFQGWIVDVGADAAGNVYALPSNGNFIMKISLAGEVESIPSSETFSSPEGLAVMPDGTCFVTDYLGHRIVKISPGGEAVNFAGVKFSSGNTDGLSEDARFNFPCDIKLGADGWLYVADRGNKKIRRVDMAGNVSSLPLPYVLEDAAYLLPLQDGTIYLSGFFTRQVRTISPQGIAGTLEMIDSATGLPPSADLRRMASDGAGNLFISDANGDRIWRRTAAGITSIWAGSPENRGGEDGQGVEAGFRGPASLALQAGGAVLLADSENHVIRKILPNGTVTTWAGGTGQPGSTDGSLAGARFRNLDGIVAASTGRLLVADTQNHTIRQILPDGTVETLAGAAGIPGFSDGANAAARFRSPHGITVDKDGNAYVADHLNNAIRKITPEGAVSTVWTVSSPRAVTMDGVGNLYVTGYDHCVRRMTPDGVKSVVAGTPGRQGYLDGNGSSAGFNYPCGITLGPDGNLYVADTSNNAVRKLTPTGEVTTVGGREQYYLNYGGYADGRGEVARFDSPVGIAVDADGVIIVADAGNNRIVRGTPVGDVPTRLVEWMAAQGFIGEDAEGAADPQRDGVPNLLKYAFNMDAKAPDVRVLLPGIGTSGLPHVSEAEGFSGRVLRVEYLRRVGSGLRYTPLRTTDFERYLPLTGPQTVIPVSDGWERVVVEENPGSSGKKRLFVRVVVSTW